MSEKAYNRRAKMNKKVGTLFPQTQEGCCSVCKEEITDNRKQRYCSDYCREVAYATQKFYLWKKVRKKVLEERENVCQKCGYKPEEGAKRKEKLKDKIEEKYDELLSLHVEPKKSLEVDHIKPVAKGGKVFDPDNLQILCEECNRSKSDKWNGEKNIQDFMSDSASAEEQVVGHDVEGDAEE